MNKIIQVLSRIAPLNEKDCDSLSKILNTTYLNKGEYWIKAEKKNHNIAFIEEGYLRKFYIKDDDEVTDFFYFENDFCADLPSIIGNLNPHASIIAMQKSILTTFSYHDFNELCKQSPTLEHISRVLVEITFLRFYKRSVSFILQTPIERYNELIVSEPKVFQKATQYHIASYLGISPQHLSRLRGDNFIS
jgi:CRP/FNR family transcriptional regulator, anaerobic regulatory protein